MKKLSTLILVSSAIMFASCGNNASDTNTNSKADSTKGSKHLVEALVKDTNRNNFTDANGKRQGHWLITNETEHLPGYLEKAKVAEGEYQDGMKEGEWVEYNADGSEKSRTTFKNDKPVN